MFALVLTQVALAADVHWARLPRASEAPIRDLAAGPSGLVLLDDQGRVLQWQHGWSTVADPDASSRQAQRLTAGEDGSIWLYRVDAPAWVVRLESEGWTEPRLPPVSMPTNLVVEQEGTAWLSGLFGQAAVWRGGQWTARTELPGNLHVEFDPTGGAWFWSTDRGGVARHSDGEERPTGLANWTPFVETLLVDGAGEPRWAANLARNGVEPTKAAASGDQLWSVHDGEVLDGEGIRRPLPAPGNARLEVGSDRVYALVGDTLFETRPGAGPSLRRAPDRLGLGDFDITHAVAIDVDLDGLQDVIGTDGQGGLLLLRQSSAGFVDITTAWGLDEQVDAIRGHCDIDGNGRADLIASTPDGFVLLRTMSGWFDRRTLEVPDGVHDSSGRAECDDVDGDGDPDLWISAGGKDLRTRRRLALFLNDGAGGLTVQSLAARGLSRGGDATMTVHPADLNGDGLLDFVLASFWTGHRVLAGTRDGRLRDVTATSGLDRLYASPWFSELDDLDSDGDADLLTLDIVGPRAWENRGDLSFVDATDRWGLPDLENPARAAFVDLNGDGLRDLLTGDRLLQREEVGFVDRSAALPPIGRAAWVLALDLGGDGDQDLLTDALVLENLSDVPLPVPEAFASSPIIRRWRWAVPADLGPAGLWVLGLLAASWWTRRSGARVWLGTLPGAGITGVAALCLWAESTERPLQMRLALAIGGVVALGGLAAAERLLYRLRRGQMVANYRLDRHLGAGGMGTVYLATDVNSGSEVALKLLHPGILATEADRERFRREATLGTRIEDPRVVRILGFGEWVAFASGTPELTAYLVMEYVDGLTLRSLLRQEGPLPPGEACALIREAALGIRAVHAAGVVHRDVKPDNIALSRTGKVKVMDFGAAERVGGGTRTHAEVLGTLGYLSPEQARGEAPSPGSDVYSLGVSLYELLAGKRPYEADDVVGMVHTLIEAAPIDIPDGLPAGLADVLMTAMAPGEQRYPDAEAFAEALAPFAAALPAVTIPAPRPARTPSRVGMSLRLFRLYLKHLRKGGAPDLDAFAVALLQPDTTQTGPSTVPETRR